MTNKFSFLLVKRFNQKNLISNEAKPIAGGKFNPWFVTGFSDAEGSFSVLIQHNLTYRTSWRVKPLFCIGLHKKDLQLLEAIQSSLGVGKIHKHGKDTLQFRVDSIKELEVIIDHFSVYPLKSEKLADFLLFRECFNIIKRKEHLTEEGLNRLIDFKASLNLGLSDKLQEAFPNAVAAKRVKPIFKVEDVDPYWVAGFTNGDGSFNIKTGSSPTTKLGSRVQLRFAIGLNIREKELILGLVKFFYPKNLVDPYKYIYENENSVSLQITNFTDIVNIIIPFFEKYSVQGLKSLDFVDFKIVANLMLNKEHLSSEGSDKIFKIKAEMNQARLNK